MVEESEAKVGMDISAYQVDGLLKVCNRSYQLKGGALVRVGHHVELNRGRTALAPTSVGSPQRGCLARESSQNTTPMLAPNYTVKIENF